MIFYTADANVPVFSTCNIDGVPKDLFTGESGTITLTSAVEISYIDYEKDINNVTYSVGNNIEVGELSRFKLSNGSIIVYDNRQQGGQGAKLSMVSPNGQEIPFNAGWGPNFNYFFYKDGPNATIMGTISWETTQGGVPTKYIIIYRKLEDFPQEDIFETVQGFLSGGNNDAEEDANEGSPPTPSNYDNDTTVDIGWPSINSSGLLSTNMVHAYALTAQQAQTLARNFWTIGVVTLLKYFVQDPLEAVIGFNFVPYNPSHMPTPSNIKMGLITLHDCQGYAINQQWQVIEGGSIKIVETWGNFIDYTSTRISIYIPFIGEHELSVAEVMDSTLTLRYYIDNLTGDITALLKITKNADKNIAKLNSVMYSYNGNVASMCPLSASDYSHRISTGINAGISLGTAIATGMSTENPQAYIGAQSASIGASMLNSMSVPVQHVGSLKGNTGFMSPREAYIKITKAVQAQPSNYRQLKGIPSNTYTQLSIVSGYTEIDAVKLENMGDCTDTELDMIREQLSAGVYF